MQRKLVQGKQEGSAEMHAGRMFENRMANSEMNAKIQTVSKKQEIYLKSNKEAKNIKKRERIKEEKEK